MARFPKYPQPSLVPPPVKNGLNDWLASKPDKKPTARTVTPKTWEKALFVVREMFASGDWTKATPIHLVATYAILHRQTYGILPGELDAKELHRARAHATGFFVDELDSDWAKFVLFSRWVWAREKQREEWRRTNNQDFRLSIRAFFSKNTLTDWLVTLNRSGVRGIRA